MKCYAALWWLAHPLHNKKSEFRRAAKLAFDLEVV